MANTTAHLQSVESVVRGHEQRLARGRLGASESAIAAGKHPYSSPITLWQRLTGELPPFEGNEFTAWGKRLEDTVRGKYVEDHGVDVHVPPESILKEDWARCTPDGIVVKLGNGSPSGKRSFWSYGLEIKTAGARSAHRWGESGSGIYPEEYRCQMAWSCWVCDLPKWDLAVLIGGNDYREYTYKRNKAFERELVQACREFWWGHVVPKVPPPVDASEDYKRYLDTRYPRVQGDLKSPTGRIDMAIRELRQWRQESAVVAAKMRGLENELRDYIGDDLGVVSPAGIVKWSERKGAVAWKKIAEELMAQAELGDIERLALKDKHRGQPYRWLQVPRDWK
jgi:putative phage-type endonuclease